MSKCKAEEVNIYFINGDNKGEVNKRDGYVYGQFVRGASGEFKTWLLEPKGYRQDTIVDEDGKEITFTHKSRIFPKELNVNLTVPGQKKKKKKRVVIDQKQMVYYSEKYAKKQRRDREAMIVRAKDLILHPKRYDDVIEARSSGLLSNDSPEANLPTKANVADKKTISHTDESA